MTIGTGNSANALSGNDSQPAVLTIIDPGFSTTVQDEGRLGSIHYGVSPSGAVDPRSMVVANANAGNAPGTSVLESLFGTLTFRLSEDRWCAHAGARSEIMIDGNAVTDPKRFFVPAGALVEILEAGRGLYGVLAVAGGFHIARTLGSASTDTLSGIGPARLQRDDTLLLGEAPSTERLAAGHRMFNVQLPPERAEIVFRWGPRHELFTAADRELLVRTEWLVSNDTNRVGARLDGARLAGGDGTLPSEGIMSGAIQIPPSGQPIVFLADRPVTGGYPVIGVVDEHQLGLFAQVRPGARIRFRPADSDGL